MMGLDFRALPAHRRDRARLRGAIEPGVRCAVRNAKGFFYNNGCPMPDASDRSSTGRDLSAASCILSRGIGYSLGYELGGYPPCTPFLRSARG
jgi:hypothetical protein